MADENAANNVRHREINGIHGNNGVSEITSGEQPNKDSHDDDATNQSKCSRIHEALVTCGAPCLKSRHPLPESPSAFERMRHVFMFPPNGNLAFYVQFVIVCVQIWIVLYAFTKGEALPGGNFFSLLILFVCCAVGGYVTSFVHLPPLLGMLIVGVMLRNIPGVSVIGEHIDTKWSGTLRKVALTVILTRAGLGLDVVKLKKLSFAVLRLAFLPSFAEIVTVTIVSHFLIGIPWKWSMLLGCILGALSPAVTVPILVNLQDRKYGVAKGIPTMLLAAGGLDNVFCVTGFSVFFGIIFSEGDLAVTIIKGPAGVLLGIVYGFVTGIFMWYIPAKDSPNILFYRSMLLFGFGLVAIFGSSLIGLSGAGPLGCLTTATVAAYKWRQRRKTGETDELAGVMALTWLIVQHFLFGLIGSAVNISHIQSRTAGYGIATLAIGLIARSIMSSTATMGTGFNVRERVFVTLTWLSKATVQAALGGLALDRVRSMDNPDPEQEELATDVLTLAVLAIVICAPIGATLMSIIGPRVLVQGDEEEIAVDVVSNGKDKPELDDSVSIKVEMGGIDDRRISGISIENMDNFKSELSMALANKSSKTDYNNKPPTPQANPFTNVTGNFGDGQYLTGEYVALNNDEQNASNGLAETGFSNPAFIETEKTEIDAVDTDFVDPKASVPDYSIPDFTYPKTVETDYNIPEITDTKTVEADYSIPVITDTKTVGADYSIPEITDIETAKTDTNKDKTGVINPTSKDTETTNVDAFADTTTVGMEAGQKPESSADFDDTLCVDSGIYKTVLNVTMK